MTCQDAKNIQNCRMATSCGSIKYLGRNRRNCYAVHPPTTEFTIDGIPKTPKALCYVDDWMKGFSVLTAYKAGTYVPGMEKELSADMCPNDTDIIQKILADYALIKGVEPAAAGKSFREVFEDYYLDKFGAEYGHKGKKKSMEYSMAAAFKNCSALHAMPFKSITKSELQKNLDNCGLKHSSLELILTLYHQIYYYALSVDECEKDYSKFVTIRKEDDDKSGIPFLDDELKILWDHKENETAEMLLIMCYSGYRISAYKSLEINLKEWYFKGGVKTKTGRNRIVPIHTGIRSLVKRRMQKYGKIMPVSEQAFRNDMKEFISGKNFHQHEQPHTPHDCRTTFSTLCEKYKVNENDRKRLLGHSFGNDITNARYSLRTLEELREEIEKIKVCY